MTRSAAGRVGSVAKPGRDKTMMYGRFDRNSRHLKHWSTVPFTVPVTDEERDEQFSDDTVRPGRSVRATPDWAGLEVDPEPEPPPPPHLPNQVLGYTVEPPVWFCASPTVDSWDTRSEEVFRQHVGAQLSLSALRGSVLVFDFTAWPGVSAVPSGLEAIPQIERLHGEWLEVINCHAACLAHASAEVAAENLRKREIKPADLLFIHSGMPLAGPGLVSLWGMRSLPPPHITVSSAVLGRAAQLTAEVLRDREVALPTVALLNRAATYCEAQTFALALVTAWTISERLLNVLRQRHGVSHGTAATITAKLASAGHLPATLSTRLTNDRKARNTWLHSGGSVEWPTANAAIETASTMLAHVIGIRLRLPLIRGVQF